jgi:hypothetical protein
MINSTNVPPLEGYYKKEGYVLKSSKGFQLLIRNRSAKNTTASKTSQFLLKVDADGSREYISSLWQTRTAGTHEFEHNGIRYAVTLTQSQPYIAPLFESRTR